VEYQRQKAKELTKFFQEQKYAEVVEKSQVFGWNHVILSLNQLRRTQRYPRRVHFRTPLEGADADVDRTSGEASSNPKDTMDLSLKIDPAPVSPADTSTVLGHPDGTTVVYERDGQRAWLHAPTTATEPLPLLIVLHGAGKNRMWNLKESVDAWAARAEAHGAIILYPEARDHTWDYIKSKRTARRDFDFLQDALSQTLRCCRVDRRRIALLGISDGGSMALTLATHNPRVFQAAMSVSAGFCAAPPGAIRGQSPRLLLLHGSHDSMFPLSRIGLPLRDKLLKLGYSVEHHVGQNEGHVPQGWQEVFLPTWLAMGTK